MKAPLALLAVLLCGPASGDPHEYVQGGIGDLYLVCDAPGRPGIGGVCIEGGHIDPDDRGEATLSISDASVSPAGAFHCQDLNGDGICGMSPDPFGSFCGSVTLDDGDNWVSSLDLIVRVNGPIFGAPLLNPCGLTSSSVGTVGFATHS